MRSGKPRTRAGSYPAASSVGASDLLIVEQGGETKHISRSDEETLVIQSQVVDNVSGLRVVNGNLYLNGQSFRHIGINAWDLFYDYLKGGSAYLTDLPVIAASGVKIVRVSATPNVAGDIITYIGTNGASPVAGYLSKLRTFLDNCVLSDIAVVLTIDWNFRVLNTALGGTLPDYANSASATRQFHREFTATLASSFLGHPGIAAWGIGNEYLNYAWLSKFISDTTTPPNTTHIAAMLATINEMVAEIRRVGDNRAIFSPGGLIGSGSVVNGGMGEWRTLAQRYVQSAGDCDVVSLHVHPDDYINSRPHAFVGADYGAAETLITAIRNEALSVGKSVVIEEVNAEFDVPPNGAISTAMFDAFTESGVELLLDWGWFVNTPGPADLKTDRNAVMSTIQARNGELESSKAFIKRLYPLKGEAAIPATAFYGTGATNSYIRIPNHSDLTPSAGQPFSIMFWLKKLAPLSGQRRIIASNNGTGGLLLTSFDMNASGSEDWVNFLFGVSSTYKGLSDALNNKAYLGEWHHYAFYWDGVVSGNSWFTSWIDGVVATNQVRVNVGSPSPTDRSLYLGSASDGSSPNKLAMSDVIIKKGLPLTTKEVNRYVMTGTVPSGSNHRWKLDGNANDSIGILHGVVGAAATFAENGLKS